MISSSSAQLTVPDLVLLSLLAERPMHGYEINAVLEERHIRDWADLSRPQVYYSLEKLARLGLLQTVQLSNSTGLAEQGSARRGPDRRVYKTTKRGISELARALERENWSQQSDRPPFLTWLALSWQCKPAVLLKQIARRRDFLEEALSQKQDTLRSVLAEVGHEHHEAVWMLKLMIDKDQVELKWLKLLEEEMPSRRPAENHGTRQRI